MDADISAAAALIGDSSRAHMLWALMGGLSLPAGELAMSANIAPQTASAHLSKLLEGNFLACEIQGRHRYYRLASPEVAAVIEGLAAIAPRWKGAVQHWAAQNDRFRFARTCYSHLAGTLAVQINDALQERGFLAVAGDKRYHVTNSGRDWFNQSGIEIAKLKADRDGVARQCLDWTERRHHLAGALGTALFARSLEMKWFVRVEKTRVVRVTSRGQEQLRNVLGIEFKR